MNPEPPPGRLPTVVRIGASAGGLAALKIFLEHVPPHTFVVVIHPAPDHESHLAELLQPSARFPVEQVTQNTPLERNHVDDDQSIRDSARALLRSAGYQVATFKSCEQFLESGMISETACLIPDVRMPGINGLELQRKVNIQRAGIPIVFITAHDNEMNRRRAIDGGASDFLQKPFPGSEFLAAIEKALTSPHHGRTLESLDGAFASSRVRFESRAR